MGFREKVTLSLVIVIILQITCRHCMPPTTRKSSLKGYPNNYKPINPKTSTFSPTQTKKNNQKQQTAKAYNPPNKSLYKTYNFPENDYPLDTSPKDSFNFGKNYNAYNKPRKNVVSPDINNLKREMKMKRKLSNNRQLKTDNFNTNNEISSALATFTSDTAPRVLDPASFPDVQYPTNTMETWGPNYWNYLSLSQNDKQTVYPKVNEINRTPTRLTKAKAYHFLQPYKKLKEEREYSKASSKRSNPGGKGLNFTKTATSEKISEDVITTSLLSSILSLLSDANETSTEVTSRTEKRENSSDYLIQNKKNESLVIELQNNTKTKEDDEVIVKATDHIKVDTTQIEALDYKKNSSNQITDNLSNDTHNISDQPDTNTFNDINNDVPLNGDTPTNVSRANCTVDEPTDKLIIPITNDPNTASGFVQNNMLSTAFQSSDDSITNNNVGPLNVKMPFSNSNPIFNSGFNNIIASPANYVSSLSNGNTGSGTSIIIIPFNNGVNNPQSDTPIILYIPTNPLPRDPPAPNYPHNDNCSETMSDTSNNTSLSPCSNITQLFNDNPTANAFVSELPLNGASSNYVTNSGSQLPIFETLPRNSMCYNSANCPSSFREESSLSNPTNKGLTNSLPSKVFGTINDAQREMQNRNTEDQASPQDLPVFNFPHSDLTLLSEDLYSKILYDELPTSVREVASDVLKPNEGIAGNVKYTDKSSLETEQTNILVDKSALVKEAFKNATLTLFPSDKHSLPVYNAILKVLLNNATIRNMLSKKRQPTEHMTEKNIIQQSLITDTATDFPEDEIVLLLPSSNLTTSSDVQPKPANKSSLISPVTVNNTPSQNLTDDRKQPLKETKTNLPLTRHDTVIPEKATILPSDPGTDNMSEHKQEYIPPYQTTEKEKEYMTLEKNTNSESNIESLPNSKISSLLSDVNSQSKLTSLQENSTSAETSEKPNATLLPISTMNNVQKDSDSKIQAVAESPAISNFTIFPETSQSSEESNASTDSFDSLDNINLTLYDGFDTAKHAEDDSKLSLDTDQNYKNSFTVFPDASDMSIILDDQVIKDQSSSNVEKVTLDTSQTEHFNRDFSSLSNNKINNATSAGNVTANDSIRLSTPLSIDELLEDKVLDTSEVTTRSNDGLTMPSDKARAEYFFNIPADDLSILLNVPQAVDEPQLTVFNNSYTAIHDKSLLRDDNENALIESEDANRVLPQENYSEVPLTIEDSNSPSEKLVEDSTSGEYDLSLDNEPFKGYNMPDNNNYSYDNQPHSRLETANSNSSVILHGWSQPLDEMQHNITLLENYSNNFPDLNKHSMSQPEKLQTYTLSKLTNPLPPMDNMDIDNLVPYVSKEVLTHENSTYIPTSLGEIIQSLETDDLPKLEDERQQDLYQDRKESELPSDKSLNTYDVSNQNEEDGEEDLSYPENLSEEENNFTEVKRRPLSLPMAKAILENVLFNIYTGGLKIPVPKRQRNKKQSKLPTLDLFKDQMKNDN